jgi:hypothetical protein
VVRLTVLVADLGDAEDGKMGEEAKSWPVFRRLARRMDEGSGASDGKWAQRIVNLRWVLGIDSRGTLA